MKNGKNKKAEGPEPSRRVVVAMSGGVDSSVVAALLKKQGYFVMGVFMKFWKDPSAGSGQAGENRCCSADSEKRARQVAKVLKIPFYVLNAEKEFKKEVVDYFLKEYKMGNTPNPCVVCNKEIKFGFLINKALKMGADFIATGHYAKIKNGKLLKGKDKNKDQSYFLWQLSQKQLSRVLFPVGNYTKPQVRALARKFKLPVAEIPESQEVCFIQDSTNNFLKKYLKEKPGKIIEFQDVRHTKILGHQTFQEILGEHRGLCFYTIGQRKGIGLSGGPYFVVAKDIKNNNLIVSKNQKDLFSKELILKNVNWNHPQKLPLSLNIEVKIRYKSNFAKAKILNYRYRQKSNDRIISDNSRVKIIFQKPQKSATSGQSAVFYKGEELLGGGVIE